MSITCYTRLVEPSEFPMRINKYLAHQKVATRRDADKLIAAKKVYINDRVAVLGDKVNVGDKVEVRATRKKAYRYFAYNKPKGVITHSPQQDEQEVADDVPIPGVFPVGRLDKDSYGLLILTDDGRLVDALLNPEHEHEKEYIVSVKDPVRKSFKGYIEAGVAIEGYTTKPCTVVMRGPRTFSIVLTEGKKHQIRRMVSALHNVVTDLKRTRIMNIELGKLKPGEYRALEEKELRQFLTSLGFV